MNKWMTYLIILSIISAKMQYKKIQKLHKATRNIIDLKAYTELCRNTSIG